MTSVYLDDLHAMLDGRILGLGLLYGECLKQQFFFLPRMPRLFDSFECCTDLIWEFFNCTAAGLSERGKLGREESANSFRLAEALRSRVCIAGGRPFMASMLSSVFGVFVDMFAQLLGALNLGLLRY